MPSDLPEADLRVRLVAVLGVATGCFQPAGMATASGTEASETSATSTSGDPVTQGDGTSGPSGTSAGATTGSESTSSPITSGTSGPDGTSSTSDSDGTSTMGSVGTEGCTCGDGSVGCEEDCDEGGDSPLCGADCRRKWLNVFVTQSPSTGMMAGSDALKAADQLCQAEAIAAGLPVGTYRAWLSDAGTSAVARFDVNDDRPYVLARTELVVSASLATLVMGSIDRPIDHDAWGEPVAGDPDPCAENTQVWTGTGPGGQSSGPYCLDWTMGTDGFMGLVGSFRPDPLGQWSNCATINCNMTARLYCFEQRPVG